MEKQKKSGFIALVGRPNVGKSTLMNHLIGQKIAITSRKPQTTRNQIRTVYTDERGQAVFLDTPGIHKAQNRLGTYMVEVAQKTFSQADIVMWLVEPTTFIGRGEQEIAKKLRQLKCPVFLIVNKTDTVKKEAVAECIKAYRQIADFNEVVAVSALRSVNTDTLLDTVFRYLPYGPMYYDEDTITDQPERQIVAELVREKALRLLSQEIPHGIAVVIERMKTRKNGNIVDIEAVIVCERESHKRIIIGKKGAMIKEIGTQARVEMENLLDMKVNLRLWVKVRKDWRDSDILLKNYGYNKKEL
jgi:GTP-binding protein Era